MEGLKNISFFPKVILIADFNELTYLLCKKLIENACRVTVVSKNSNWKQEFSEERLFKIGKVGTNHSFYEDADYVICVTGSGFNWQGGDKLLAKDEKKLELTRKLSAKSGAKTAIIFSWRQTDRNYTLLARKLGSEIDTEIPHTAKIFLGDIVSKDEKAGGVVFSIFNKTKENGVFFNDSENKTLYLLTSESAVKKLIRLIFSLKAYSKNTAILGRPFSISKLYRLVKTRLAGSLERQEVQGVKTNTVDVDEKVLVEENVNPALLEIFKDTQAREKPEARQKHVAQKEIIAPRRVSRKWIYTPLAAFILFLVAPFILVFFGASFLSLSALLLKSGFLAPAEYGLSTSLLVTNVSQKYSEALSQAPLLGRGYEISSEASELIVKEVQLGQRVLKIIDLGLNLTDALTKGVNYDLMGLSSTLSLEAESLYQDLGFYENELATSFLMSRKIALMPFPELDLSEVRKDLLNIKEILDRLPLILGSGTSSQYAFLFQDNSSLRPTGGKIANYSLIAFSGGNILDRRSFRTDELKSSIQGRVEPPTPLAIYFESDSWGAENANWDPDFSVSATQFEWFLDKGMSTSIDGAIAYDSSFLKNLVEVMGEASLEGDFIGWVGTLNEREKIRLGKVVLSSLNKRSLQVFSKEQSVQRALADLGWAGLVYRPVCKDNCYSDFLMVFETNFGEDSTNIKREAEVSVSLEEGLIKRRLAYFMENPGGESYKTYLRLWAPGESGHSPVSVVLGEATRSETPDKKGIRGFSEAGVFLEVLANEALAVIFTWEGPSFIDYNNEGEYRILWRKQAGVSSYPFEITISTPENLNASFDSDLSLTDGGEFNYNTNLSEDYSARIFW